jgi:hypothetical protein
VEYSLTLGLFSNDLEKVYGLYQGLKIVKFLKILNLTVIGDSLVIIMHMTKGANSFDVRLTSMISWIRHLSSSFSHLSFYHVLRRNNIEGDQLESLTTS